MKMTLSLGLSGLCRVMTVGVLVLSGCVNLSKSFPDKHYYALNTTRIGARPTSSSDHILAVAPFRVVPRYEGREIVYRRGEFSYESDFYHEWFSLPSSMVTAEMERWLEQSGVFAHVVNQSLSIEPTFLLEGLITELYGDYRSKAAPKAAIGLEFYLMRAHPGGDAIVFQQDYRQAIDVSDPSPEALAKGWNEGLELIFTALEKDLMAAAHRFSDGAPMSSDRKEIGTPRHETVTQKGIR